MCRSSEYTFCNSNPQPLQFKLLHPSVHLQDYSPAIPSGKLTMQPVGTNLKVGEKLMSIAVPEAGESYFQIGLGTSLSVL